MGLKTYTDTIDYRVQMQYISVLWKCEMKLFYYIVVLCCALSTPVQATQILKDALRQAEEGNINAARAARSSLQGNARDALNWYIYTQKDHNIPFEEVAAFLTQNPKWPYSITIQENAEENLKASLSPQAYQFFNAKTPVTAKAMDIYLRALKANKQDTKARQVLNKWWPDADLSRDEQRQIFSTHGVLINQEAQIKRLHALLDDRKYDNAQAIASVLGNGYDRLASARRALGKNSGDVNAQIAAVPKNLSSDVGLMFDRLQWRRKKDLTQGAIEILKAAPMALQMRHPKKWWRERHIMTRRLMESRQYQAAYRLASQHKQTSAFPQLQAEWLSGFLALRFVKQPYKAFEHFEALYKAAKSPISKARGAYWAGRASEDLNSREIANKWYNVATKYPETFYGQLAGEKLGRILSLNIQQASGQNLSIQNPLVGIAEHLSAAGLKKESGAFLTRAMNHSTTAAELEYIAATAVKLEQNNIAIRVAQELQKKYGVTLGGYLYPQKTQELKYVRDVEWAFINAIIRQESRFDQNAVSHAGARGLMQLMPATARETASRMGLNHQKSWLTTRPSHNMRLGAQYLGQMLRRYDGNYAMAAAAYNAGPGRVDRWIKEIGDPRTEQIDFIDWAEQIPIYETRNYVQRVLEAVYIYRQRFKGKQPNVGNPIHVASLR